MERKKTVYLNGKFLKAEEALISAQDPGFLLGLGLFETMRCFQGRIIHLDWHLARIKNAAKLIHLDLPLTAAGLKNKIIATSKLNRLQDTQLRLTIWKSLSGTGVFILVKEYSPFTRQKYQRGFSAVVSSFRQDENSLLTRIKSTNRLIFNLSLAQAKKRGFDEAIILNHRGLVTEGARSNIFFRSGNTLFTPALSNGCLEGITRRVIFNLAQKKQIKICEGDFTLEDLQSAEEAFLTNSLIGVMPLTSLENKAIGNGKIGKTSKSFLEAYLLLLKNDTKKNIFTI